MAARRRRSTRSNGNDPLDRRRASRSTTRPSPTATASSRCTTSTTRAARSCSAATAALVQDRHRRRSSSSTSTRTTSTRRAVGQRALGHRPHRRRRRDLRRPRQRLARRRHRAATRSWGGFGDDLANADDDLTTNGGLNDRPDTHPSYEDRVVGGAGLDVLIANTGGDRLIDWQGYFNTFIVPFWDDAMPTVSRWYVPERRRAAVPPHRHDAAVGRRGLLRPGQAADARCCSCRPRAVQPQRPRCRSSTRCPRRRAPTRRGRPTTARTPTRNGEPHGELGLVTPYDGDLWHEQIGLPSDPPGFIPFQRRDVAPLGQPTRTARRSAAPTLEDSLFGGTHVANWLFPYTGRTLNLGVLVLDIGGVGHDLGLTLARRRRCDARHAPTWHLTLGQLLFDLDLGIWNPDDEVPTLADARHPGPGHCSRPRWRPRRT